MGKRSYKKNEMKQLLRERALAVAASSFLPTDAVATIAEELGEKKARVYNVMRGRSTDETIVKALEALELAERKRYQANDQNIFYQYTDGEWSVSYYRKEDLRRLCEEIEINYEIVKSLLEKDGYFVPDPRLLKGRKEFGIYVRRFS